MSTRSTKLEMHVRMLSQEFHPRNWEHPGNMGNVAKYISNIFTLYDSEPEFQDFEVYGAKYSNVIARYGPKTGTKLVVGAHYDSCHITPGADDNASGVAGLLELAGMLRDNPPKIPVELVAYALEEPPFFGTNRMGSYKHAQTCEPGQAIGAIVLEMIGYFSDVEGSQSYPFPAPLYPQSGNFIAVVGDTESGPLVAATKRGMEVASIPVLDLAGPRNMDVISLSDHSSYWRFGIPGIMVTDTAFLRNPNYHGAGDTADTLDYERMVLVVNGVFHTIKSMKLRK